MWFVNERGIYIYGGIGNGGFGIFGIGKVEVLDGCEVDNDGVVFCSHG